MWAFSIAYFHVKTSVNFALIYFSFMCSNCVVLYIKICQTSGNDCGRLIVKESENGEPKFITRYQNIKNMIKSITISAHEKQLE